MKCKAKVFVKILNKHVPCIRKVNHNCNHTADLRGQKFGDLVVVCLGKPYYQGGYPTPTWIVEQNGFRRTVMNRSLREGASAGIITQHGLSHTKEYETMLNHFRNIFNAKGKFYPNYRGMPFYSLWNPKKGGHLWKGAKWIIDNLGKRPGKGWSIDIIEREKGFTPGNLRWANRFTQNLNKRHRKLGTYTIKELRVESRRHGYKLVKI